MTKDNKWLLASHMQKALRRGLKDEALWAMRHLHDLDRSYMAYRLGVIMAEDIVGSGEIVLPKGNNAWGARYFDAKKSPEELAQWEHLVSNLSSLTKDSTCCEHIACVAWKNDFEQMEGRKWEDVSPHQALEGMHNTDKPWWWRGLMSWRAIGTKKYPNDLLGEVEGEPLAWLETLSPLDKQFVETVGFKHIEPHVVFLPLIKMYQQEDLKNGYTVVTEHTSLVSGKSGPWLHASLDKHTREGGQALSLYLKQSPSQDLQELKNRCDPYDAVGRLYFWAEGGKHDLFLSSHTSSQIKKDIRKRWLHHYNLNGKWFFDTWFNLPKMNECRDQVILSLKPSVLTKPK